MKQYLVLFYCDYPDEHPVMDTELLVSCMAESADQLEAPLKQALDAEQARAGFNRVYIMRIVEVPPRPSAVFSLYVSKRSSHFVGSGCEYVVPAWFPDILSDVEPERSEPWSAAMNAKQEDCMHHPYWEYPARAKVRIE